MIRADIASCVVAIRAPQGRGKIRSNEQNVRSYYMLNHRIRGLLFHYKKKIAICSWLATILLVRVFKKVLIPSVRMTLTLSKMFARIICQTIEWEKQKKKIYIYYFGFYFLVRVSKTSYSSVIVAPFESAGIRSVVNRLNQDTTLYYGLVFCAFSWTCMVKDIIVEW